MTMIMNFTIALYTIAIKSNEEKTMKNEKLFLFLNTIAWAIIGFVLWCVVRLFALDCIEWAICFVGYPAFFIGIVGGVLYLWNRN